MNVNQPRWTVHYNIRSRRNDYWVGTGWEFFTYEDDAQECYYWHYDHGNVPTIRPFHPNDWPNLGAAHARPAPSVVADGKEEA